MSAMSDYAGRSGEIPAENRGRLAASLAWTLAVMAMSGAMLAVAAGVRYAILSGHTGRLLSHLSLTPFITIVYAVLGALRRAIRGDPREAEALVDEFRRDLRVTIEDIRRLVYALRPPTLDQLGLVMAVRAIRAVGEGEAIFSPAIASRLIDYFAASRSLSNR